MRASPTAALWAPQIEALDRAGHRPIAPDLPGFGEADPIARLETIAGAGHLPSLERPDELNRLLLEFLS